MRWVDRVNDEVMLTKTVTMVKMMMMLMAVTVAMVWLMLLTWYCLTLLRMSALQLRKWRGDKSISGRARFSQCHNSHTGIPKGASSMSRVQSCRILVLLLLSW